MVRFNNRIADSAGQARVTPGVSTNDECASRCIGVTNCVGVNWMRDGRSADQRCLLYIGTVGDTRTSTQAELWLLNKCQPRTIILPGIYAQKPAKTPARRDN